jgi:uncharacterized protein YrrD
MLSEFRGTARVSALPGPRQNPIGFRLTAIHPLQGKGVYVTRGMDPPAAAPEGDHKEIAQIALDTGRSTTMVRRDEFIKTHPGIRTGMEAYDNKGERIGLIERIDDDSITIEKGHIFHHDVSLPYDAIEDIREDQVIIRRGEGFEKERLESEEEELERQYERDRSAREEQFEGVREDIYEWESAWGDVGTEEATRGENVEGRQTLDRDESGMQEDLGEGSWQQSPRREPGLEEVDAGNQARAGSGWEERESTLSEEEVRVPVQEEEIEATRKPVAKEEEKAKPGKNVQKK